MSWKIEPGMKLEAFTEDSFSGWWAIRDSVTGDEVGSCDGGFFEEDARLFAAAPDMLEALQSVSEWLSDENYFNNGLTHMQAKTLFQGIVKEISPTIAKALGENNV